jgi:hypothetical protein
LITLGLLARFPGPFDKKFIFSDDPPRVNYSNPDGRRAATADSFASSS